MKLNVRKLYSSLAKPKEVDAEGMRVMLLSERKRGRHLSHYAKANTVTQPYIPMGQCRVRPVTVLRAVGEIELNAQRLDLEGKHAELLCDSRKSRTLDKYKWGIFTERAVTPICPKSLCLTYEENARVKYPGRVYIDFGQACLIISMSRMIHRSCIDMCGLQCHTLYTWYK